MPNEWGMLIQMVGLQQQGAQGRWIEALFCDETLGMLITATYSLLMWCACLFIIVMSLRFP